MTWSYIQKRPYFKLIFLGGILEYIKAILLKIKRMAFKKVPTTVLNCNLLIRFETV
jgi:hypothetical protein